MQSQGAGPSAPVTADTRSVEFPGGRQNTTVQLAAARSGYIRAISGTSGLRVPAEVFDVWLQCVWDTEKKLRARDEFTLAAYLRVRFTLLACEYFDDPDTVDVLCELLGRRLFTPAQGADYAVGPVAFSDTQKHVAKVLEGVPERLLLEVLRRAPSSLEELLPRLPQCLTSLAALAHVPSLLTVCEAAPECAEHGACEDCTTLTLCVDTSPAVPVGLAADSDDEHDEAADSEAAARMWLLRGDEVPNGALCPEVFSLRRRPGVVVCRLTATVSKLQGATLRLPDRSCLLLGPGALQLKDVKFKGGGGSVVCSGPSCDVTFEDAEFEDCSLLVLADARVTLSSPVFNNTPNSDLGLGMLVHGVSSRVTVRGGSVQGGTQGAAVQAGAHLSSTDLVISGVGVEGVGVQGEGSTLELTRCKVQATRAQLGRNGEPTRPLHRGVCVSSGALAYLDDCRMAHGRLGVGVAQGAEARAHGCQFRHHFGAAGHVVGPGHLELIQCTSGGDHHGFVAEQRGSVIQAEDTWLQMSKFWGGFCAFSGASMNLVHCKAMDCRGGGVLASGNTVDGDEPGHDEATTATVSSSQFLDNFFGIKADRHAVVTVVDCETKGHVRNEAVGFVACGAGFDIARMEARSSKSAGDIVACSAEGPAELTMHDVVVSGDPPQTGVLEGKKIRARRRPFFW